MVSHEKYISFYDTLKDSWTKHVKVLEGGNIWKFFYNVYDGGKYLIMGILMESGDLYLINPNDIGETVSPDHESH